MANTSTTPRTMRSESLCTAQIHALELHATELENFVNNTIFLSKCVKKRLLQPLDIEKINKKKTPAEKVKMLIMRIQKFPYKYLHLIRLLRIYQTEKDKNIASNIEAAKSEKERKIAIEKLSELVCHKFCPILTGKEPDKSDKYQNLSDIVAKFTELGDSLEEFQTKAKDKNAEYQDSLSQLQQEYQQSQQTINQLQEEITRQGEIIQTLQHEKEEIQEQMYRTKTELQIRENWITRIEDDKEPSMLRIKNKNLEVPETKFGNSSQNSFCCNNPSPQNLSSHADAHCSTPAHNNDVMATVNSHSHKDVLCQMPKVQGHRPVQGQNSMQLSRVEDKKDSFHDDDDQEINEMSQMEKIATEKQMKQTSSRTRSNEKDRTLTKSQHHTYTENTEILECTSDTSRSVSALSITQSSESNSTISINEMFEKRNDNVIANKNQNVIIQNNRYQNCTIIKNYKRN